VGVDTDSFAAGLKSALRQAPDVILIGEMRDLETVEAAIHFAETGHLVLGTLHANNANQAVERLMKLSSPWKRTPDLPATRAQPARDRSRSAC